MIDDFLRFFGVGKKEEEVPETHEYPKRVEVTVVRSEHVNENVVGAKGVAHRTDNGIILILLDNGEHVWGREVEYEEVSEEHDGSK